MRPFHFTQHTHDGQGPRLLIIIYANTRAEAITKFVARSAP